MSPSLSKTLTSILIALSIIAIAPMSAMSHVNTMYFAGPNSHRGVREAYLYSFAGTPDGSFPTDIIQFKGAFYGTTQNGGANGAGSFFVISKTASGYNEQVLYSFPSGTGLSGAPLAVNDSGVFFGTTFLDGTGTACGGSGGCADIYALVPTASGYVHKIIHKFDQKRDGGNPTSPVILDSDGALYGSTSDYGPGGGGTVFKLTPTSSGYSEQVLYAFGTQHGDGLGPTGPLLVNGAGDIYGVTFSGGSNPSPAEGGAGNAFELTKTANGYVEHVLYQFGSHTGDGINPGSLVFNPVTETFFGVTDYGGDTGCGLTFGCGTVFELFPKQGYREQIVHTFDGTNGGQDFAALEPNGKGGFYGVTEVSGSPLKDFGVLFELTPSTNGFAYNVLYQFTGQNDGHAPCTVLLLNQALFGLTLFGGRNDNGTPLGDGTFFEITQ